MKRLIAAIALTFATSVATVGAEGPEKPGQTYITGCGAMNPMAYYLKLASEFNKRDSGIQFDYTGGGSGIGKQRFAEGVANFAGVDSPLSAEALAKFPKAAIQFPVALGAVVMIYNLPEVKSLTLSGPVIAGIYMGRIRRWNDPEIAKLNPKVTLPDLAISNYHFSGLSGVNYTFTSYVCVHDEVWKKHVGAGMDVQWVCGTGIGGCDSVASEVKNTEGGLGFVEFGYADACKIPYANLLNNAGNVVTPSARAVEAAAEDAEIGEAGEVRLYGSKAKEGYPLAGATYILVRQEQADAKVARPLAEFLWNVTHEGQSIAGELKYARLSKKMVESAEASLRSMTHEGKAVLPQK